MWSKTRFRRNNTKSAETNKRKSTKNSKHRTETPVFSIWLQDTNILWSRHWALKRSNQMCVCCRGPGDWFDNRNDSNMCKSLSIPKHGHIIVYTATAEANEINRHFSVVDGITVSPHFCRWYGGAIEHITSGSWTSNSPIIARYSRLQLSPYTIIPQALSKSQKPKNTLEIQVKHLTCQASHGDVSSLCHTPSNPGSLTRFKKCGGGPPGDQGA